MARTKIMLARIGLLLPVAAVAALTLAPRPPAPPPPKPRQIVARAATPQPAPAPAPAPTPTATPYVVRRILDVPGVMRIGDTYWDETGAPDGPIVITVDLHAQVLSIFRAGYEIGTAAILYGGDEKPTPLGIFPVTQKDARHVSNLYHAPMPYMLRLTDDGISIHGSPSMAPGLMTHGCVGVPVAFAAKLFRAVKLGDKVIVTNGETLDLGKPITAA